MHNQILNKLKTILYTLLVWLSKLVSFSKKEGHCINFKCAEQEQFWIRYRRADGIKTACFVLSSLWDNQNVEDMLVDLSNLYFLTQLTEVVSQLRSCGFPVVKTNPELAPS
jgi:hypothetical protein